MRFGSLDLNLLVVLDALLDEGSVSAAARRLNLSQSAASGALARLREHFGDELLTPTGGKMIPTVRAVELRDPVREALSFIRARISEPPVFDPALAQRNFRIVASDYMLDVAIGAFLRHLEARAPRMTFEVALPSTGAFDQLHRGDVDLVMTVRDFASEAHPQVPLFEDDHVVVACADNPHLQAGLDAALFAALPHIAIHLGGSRTPSFFDRLLAEREILRRIVAIVPFFSAAPMQVIGTTRLAVMLRRQADYYAKLFPVRVHELPFAVPKLYEIAQYHTVRTSDAALQWLLEALVSFVGTTLPRHTAAA